MSQETLTVEQRLEFYKYAYEKIERLQTWSYLCPLAQRYFKLLNLEIEDFGRLFPELYKHRAFEPSSYCKVLWGTYNQRREALEKAISELETVHPE